MDLLGAAVPQTPALFREVLAPQLPDWAIVDLRTPPGPRWPGKIVDAGFFDEDAHRFGGTLAARGAASMAQSGGSAGA